MSDVVFNIPDLWPHIASVVEGSPLIDVQISIAQHQFVVDHQYEICTKSLRVHFLNAPIPGNPGHRALQSSEWGPDLSNIMQIHSEFFVGVEASFPAISTIFHMFIMSNLSEVMVIVISQIASQPCTDRGNHSFFLALCSPCVSREKVEAFKDKHLSPRLVNLRLEM